jgi:hypothetical protein
MARILGRSRVFLERENWLGQQKETSFGITK